MLLFSTTLYSQAERVNDDTIPELYIFCSVEDGEVYERQPFPVTVTLKSSSPDVATADIVSKIRLFKGEISTFQTIQDTGRPYTKKENGKMWYYFPLNAYLLSIADSGTYEIGGGEYSIGVAQPVIVKDPFWGPMQSQRLKKTDVNVSSAKIKVKRLPSKPSDFEYSGSVGNFTIQTILPKGDIYVDEEAIAYIVLQGRGMIEESTFPAYREAFTQGMKLKSVNESREESFDHSTGELVSEIRLECTFVPSRRDNVEIGEITFGYFDPKSKEYKTAKSKPLKVTVKSTTSKRESIAI